MTKKIAVVLSGIILISFFLPWFHISMETAFSMYGVESYTHSYSASMSVSLARMISEEFTGGYFSFLWIIPVLALAGVIYSMVDNKNGYSWFTLNLSLIPFIQSASFLIGAGDRLSGTGHSFGIGIYMTLFSSFMLWGISVVNNAKHYREYKKITLLHMIVAISIFIGSIVYISQLSVDKLVSQLYDDKMAISSLLNSYLSPFALLLFLSTIIIFVLAKTNILSYITYKLENNEVETEEVNETAVTDAIAVKTEEDTTAYAPPQIAKTIETSPYLPSSPESSLSAESESSPAVTAQSTAVVEEEKVVEHEEKASSTVPRSDSSTIVIKKQHLYYGIGIIVLLLIGWLIYSNTGNNANNSQGYERIFMDKYHEKPDTCIQLDNNKLLFIRGWEKDYNRKTTLYVLENKKKNPKVFRTIELDRYVDYPVDATYMEKIDGKEYLYLEYVIGGGSMGNNTIEFSLYDLNGGKDYTLSYEYYPEGLSLISQIGPHYYSLKDNPQPWELLQKKVRSSEQYKKEEFLMFIDKFCSDKEFQLSRIKFPVSYIQKEVTDLSEIDENTYFDSYERIYVKNIPQDKSQWKMIERLIPFYDAGENYFAKWEKYSNTQISFIAGWVDSDYDMAATFKKINGEWFLTSYY